MRVRLLPGLYLLAVLAFLVLNVRVGYAEPQVVTDAYEVSWYTVAGGGGQVLKGGAFSLQGTVGQFDTGVASGGAFTNCSGFWIQLDSVGYELYLPLVHR